MSTINQLEDLEIWQLARQLNYEIWQITFRPEFAKLFSLNEQMRSASLSIMNNISEGFDRSGNKEFVQFLSIAKGSAGETKNMLYALVDSNLISQKEFEDLTNKANLIRVKIFSLMKYLVNSENKGVKFKKN